MCEHIIFPVGIHSSAVGIDIPLAGMIFQRYLRSIRGIEAVYAGTGGVFIAPCTGINQVSVEHRGKSRGHHIGHSNHTERQGQRDG